LGFIDHTKPKETPALSSKILQRDEDGQDHETLWNYQRIIGQLNFLENSSRPDIVLKYVYGMKMDMLNEKTIVQQ